MQDHCKIIKYYIHVCIIKANLQVYKKRNQGFKINYEKKIEN